MAEIKKYNQIERPVQDELDRIDDALHDVSIATDDIGVHIPFGRIMPGGGGINYDYVYVGGVKYEVTAEKTSNFLQVNNDGTTEWVEAMPDVMPTNAEVYDVTKNEIHLPGETAG
jgi:Ni,Fe-hydrogenase III large subunit